MSGAAVASGRWAAGVSSLHPQTVSCGRGGVPSGGSGTQDDAHIFCTPEQIAPEIQDLLTLVEDVLGTFGFKKFEVNLSTRPDDSIGSEEVWETAERSLQEALNAKGWAYKTDDGGGAFYGPKIDIKIQVCPIGLGSAGWPGRHASRMRRGVTGCGMWRRMPAAAPALRVGGWSCHLLLWAWTTCGLMRFSRRGAPVGCVPHGVENACICRTRSGGSGSAPQSSWISTCHPGLRWSMLIVRTPSSSQS